MYIEFLTILSVSEVIRVCHLFAAFIVRTASAWLASAYFPFFSDDGFVIV